MEYQIPGALRGLGYAIIVGLAALPAAAQTLDELTKLSIEDLGTIQVTSVSKRQEPLSDAPAAVYVITNDAIRRSGARTVPEALRLAPNLNVGRLNANSYTISARGFNTFEASNKLLVLIDGRSVYTPLHSGVFWDQQSVMLQDVERIEVISGPGGTLWGANAVNGVVNIITKSSADTLGGLVSGSRGNVDSTAAARYGVKVGNASLRAYGMGANMGDSPTRAGADAGDDWENRQTGFRSDWSSDANAFTLQGDLYNNSFTPGARNSGANVLGRWRHAISETSSTSVQAYVDQARRVVPGAEEMLQTVDIEAQHRFLLGRSHDIVWGGGYRVSREEFDAGASLFRLTKTEDTNSIFNVFLQDTITVTDDIKLTLGNKFEHNNFNGLEALPSARAAWHPTGRVMLWTAVSRAIRSPSRIDRDLQAAGLVVPAPDLKPDTLIAYEAGIRATPRDDTTLSVSVFYNEYDDLRVLSVTPDGFFQYSNNMEGTTKGFEAWGEHQIRSWWRVHAGLSVLEKDLKLQPGATTASLPQHQGNDPSYQASFRSSFDITPETEFDFGIRRVDELKNPAVPGYYALDARLAWRPMPSIELAVAGLNLLDDRHPEAGDIATRLEVSRTVYASLQVKF